jgi:hypothetical protein
MPADSASFSETANGKRWRPLGDSKVILSIDLCGFLNLFTRIFTHKNYFLRRESGKPKD